MRIGNKNSLGYSITNLNTGETITDLPNYGKHNLASAHYGTIVLTAEHEVLYFYAEDDRVVYEDVSDQFSIVYHKF